MLSLIRPVLRPFAQRLSHCLAILPSFAMLSLFTAEAWAQLPQKPPPADKNYAASYFVVAMFVILGYLLVLRPSGRERDFRPPPVE